MNFCWVGDDLFLGSGDFFGTGDFFGLGGFFDFFWDFNFQANPFWEKSMWKEKERRKKERRLIIPSLVDTTSAAYSVRTKTKIYLKRN